MLVSDDSLALAWVDRAEGLQSVRVDAQDTLEATFRAAVALVQMNYCCFLYQLFTPQSDRFPLEMVDTHYDVIEFGRLPDSWWSRFRSLWPSLSL